eukprot:scaffold65189_cov21-Tisochrysis_lutea.AAC.1
MLYQSYQPPDAAWQLTATNVAQLHQTLMAMTITKCCMTAHDYQCCTATPNADANANADDNCYMLVTADEYQNARLMAKSLAASMHSLGMHPQCDAWHAHTH